MKYFIGLFTWILIASGWSIATQQLEAAQINKPQLADIRIDHDVHVENWRMLDIFLYLLRGTGLRGGFVEIAACSDFPKGRLQIKPGLTIRQAMDALVAANPSYEWELKDGVVNLMPQGGAPLLHTRIAKFQIDATDRETEAIFQDMLRFPEVRESEASLGLQQGMSGGGLSGGKVNPFPKEPVPIHIDLHNLSLLTAFNKIVQASPKGVWIYHETDCNGAKTFTVEVASDN